MTSQRESTSANRDRKTGVAADNASNTGVIGVNWSYNHRASSILTA